MTVHGIGDGGRMTMATTAIEHKKISFVEDEKWLDSPDMGKKTRNYSN